MIIFQERYKQNSRTKENIYTRIEENSKQDFARLDRAIRFNGTKKFTNWHFLTESKKGMEYFRLYRKGQLGKITLNNELYFSDSFDNAEDLFLLLTKEI